MGRVVANEEFLRALLKLNPYDQYHFYFSGSKQLNTVSRILRAYFPHIDFHWGLWSDLPEALGKTRFEVFHLSDWVVGFVPLAALRNRYSRHIFPITGIIHSLSYERYHAEFLKHLWPGCTPRDAITVTSRAGEAVVRAAFRQLRANYDLPDSFKHPDLIRIPLGIPELPDADEISRLRKQKRRSLGLDSQDIMLLYLGRICHATKKDMLPLLRALSRAGRQGLELRRMRLVLAGWVDADSSVLKALSGFAASLGIALTLVACPDNTERSELYAAADIFVSLVDNLQETFGITMLEAAAYGLPVVASDFDGYRDLVVHGETGCLVPCLGPRRSSDCDLMAPLWSDSHFHLVMAQETAIDVAKASEYLTCLANNPGLREHMGKCGRARVSDSYLWEKIIPLYINMWNGLAGRELPEQPAQFHPQQLSYTDLFAGHFSSFLSDELRVVWSRSGEALYRGEENPVFYEGIDPFIPVDMLRRMLFWARRPATIGLLTHKLEQEGFSGERADYLLLWALKHDFLEIC
ncbi:MAG: glycosyltransferase family 4 protein [Desulfovibrionaceae bacterium]|nr:glycosyltransferase family 4 protein [Desulfovibrionaceae bacterium]